MSGNSTLIINDEHTLHYWCETIMVWQGTYMKTLEGAYCTCGKTFSSSEAARVHARRPELHSTLDAWK